MKRSQFIIVVIIVIAMLAVGIGATYSASPEPSGSEEPQASTTFLPIITSFTFFVTIPDPNLNQALHDKLGKPMSEGITYLELSSMTGDLWLENLDIADAEGIQYCTSISGLFMDGNNLSSLPDMTGMLGLNNVSFSNNDFNCFPASLVPIPNLASVTLSYNPISAVTPQINSMANLTYLDLNDCAFTSFPNEVTGIPHLEILRMNNNGFGSVPNIIASLSTLDELQLNNTGLAEIPSTVYTMNHLKALFVDDNDIPSISSSISGMSSLEYLSIRNNKLQHLPDELFSLSNIKGVYADANSLYDLPSTIGSSNIEQLEVSQNRITRLPSNIGSASNLYLLDIMVNRLRELPSSFDDKSWDFINVEFNFMDVSPGSDTRTILDNTTTFTLYYERQLKPIDEVLAEPTDTSITLTWDAGEDGTGAGGSSWTVDSYKILDDSYSGIDETLPTELTYEHTGLSPETTYIYHVGVEYHVVVPSHSIDTMIRAYTDAESTTLEEGASASPSPGTSATDTPADDPSSGDSSGDADTNSGTDSETVDGEGSAAAGSDAVEIDIAGEDNSGMPVWLIIVIAVLAAGIVGTGTALIIMKVKGKKEEPPKRA